MEWERTTETPGVEYDGQLYGWTPDEMRRLWADVGVGYHGIGDNDLDMLKAMLGEELCRHNASVGGKGSALKMRVGKSDASWGEDMLGPTVYGDMLLYGFIRVDGPYFKDREAISFNKDGFVGFAGWADSTNVRPFLKAFGRWATEWVAG